MTGATLMIHRTIPAAINTSNRPKPSRIKGAFSRVQKRCLRFGDIDYTSLSGFWAGGFTDPSAGRGGRAVSGLLGSVNSSLSTRH